MNRLTPQNRKVWILDLRETDATMAQVVGAKAANLGELVQIGIRVPEGFALTTTAQRLFMEESQIARKIPSFKEGENGRDFSRLRMLSRRLRRRITEAEFPQALRFAVKASYHDLVSRVNRNASVAVRSSAISEDAVGASFAGQYESYLFVRRLSDVIKDIKRCYASAFLPRVVLYTAEKIGKFEPSKMGVIVQEMIDSSTAGVAFSLNPVTMDAQSIVIESTLGTADSITQGIVVPDFFAVDKKTGKILTKKIAPKNRKGVGGMGPAKSGRNSQLTSASRGKSSLDGENLELIIQLVKDVEQHFGRPVDIEWCIDSLTGKMFLVQARPVTAHRAELSRAQGNDLTYSRRLEC